MACVGVRAAFSVVSAGSDFAPDRVLAAYGTGSLVGFRLVVVVGASVPLGLALGALGVRIHGRGSHATGNLVIHDGEGAQKETA